MIPYPHHWPKDPSEIQREAMQMTQTPYNRFQSSPSDNINRGLVDYTNIDPNKFYRYAVPVMSQSNLYKSVFAQPSVDWISDQITSRLNGVHPDNKNIIVPDNTILSVLDSYYNNGKFMDAELIRQQTVMFIVENIKNEYLSEKLNSKLSVWNTIFTPNMGMAQTNDIILNDRKRTSSWVWNY